MVVAGGCLSAVIGAVALTFLCGLAPSMQGEAGLGCLAAIPVGGVIGGIGGARLARKLGGGRGIVDTPKVPVHVASPGHVAWPKRRWRNHAVWWWILMGVLAYLVLYSLVLNIACEIDPGHARCL
jgi:hypothetical protein